MRDVMISALYETLRMASRFGDDLVSVAVHPKTAAHMRENHLSPTRLLVEADGTVFGVRLVESPEVTEGGFWVRVEPCEGVPA